MTKKVFYPSTDSVQICALLHEPAESPKGNVVLAHGITVDKDEDGESQAGIGAFVQLADALCNAQYNILRFDFRGHGESGGLQEEMTIAGELLDLTASMDYARKRWPLPTALLAASFGAPSAVMYTADRQDIPCMVLWNPVLDLRRTFLEPDDPDGWAAQSFNPQGYAFLEEHGYMLLDGFFKLGKPLIGEMKKIKPFEYMKRIRCPVLTLHGDQDSYVPYEVAKKYARCNSQSEFVTVPGSEHGFGRPEDRQFVIPRTMEGIQRFIPSK